MRRHLVLPLLLAAAALLVVSGTAGAKPRSCGTVAYPHGTTPVSVVRGTTCPTARRVLRKLFTSRDTASGISFAISGDDGGTPTDIDVLVTVGNAYAWVCPVYRDSTALRSVTCTQRKSGGRRIHASKPVPRRVWAEALDEDTEGGGG